jgi:hypothetical protein
MRSLYGWIKTARRGSAYYRQGSKFWIFKSGNQWELLRQLPSPQGWESFGKFPTLAAAADYFNAEAPE